ncbi:MAG: 1-phosphofructokinase family hexose kinase [Rubrobacteraceae bacterium]
MQRTLFFKRLVPGEVNRAYEVKITASGKVTNAARVAATLCSQVLLATFLGGDPGRFVVRELDAEGVRHEIVWPKDSQTRTCSTLIPDDDRITELVEEAQPVSADDAAELEEIVRRHLPEAEALCLIGSLPHGVPEDFYARLTRVADETGVPVLIDAQGPPLQKALAARPFLVKPNLEEATATLKLSPSGDEERDALAAVGTLLERGACWALISMGAGGSLLGNSSGSLWRVVPPKLEAVNPIGSGDSLAAGLLHSLLQGSSVPEAAAYGTACAAANVLTPTSGVVRPKDVARLLPEVGLSRIS